MKLFAAIALLAFAGCATNPPGKPIDISTRPLELATHNDLLAAAKYAEDHGYPARGAVWRAHDAHLTAVEGQISACLNAIAAAKPSAPANTGSLGPFTLIEMGAEAVASFNQGLSAAVQINCEPLPLVNLPVIIKP